MAPLIDVRSIRALPARSAVAGTLVCSDRLARSGWDRASLKRIAFTGAAGEQAQLLNDAGGLDILVGAGGAGSVDTAALRSAAGSFARSASRHRTVVLDASSAVDAAVAAGVSASDAVAAVAEGLILGGYRFDAHKSEDGDAVLQRVNLLGTGERADADAVARGAVVATAQCWARDLVNEPGGSLTPSAFAAAAEERASALGLGVEVLGPEEIAAERLGGLLAVSRGSEQEPRFVKLTYRPAGATRSVALVGKGITFDSGGLSIKPTDGMMTMKMDMGGAAAAIAAICAVAELGLAGVDVTTYAPLTDNMLGGDAQRPGDVFTARNGKTVEVLNTDAEGRLVLADALALASESEPDLIVDLATLTGACVVALGDRIGGVLANDDDAATRVLDAAATAGERMWRLPLASDYRKQLDSDVADIKNIGAGRYAGTITAGLFLAEFVAEGTPWVHLDIAGPAWSESVEAEIPKGGTGFGVRTLVELVRAIGVDGRAVHEADGSSEAVTG